MIENMKFGITLLLCFAAFAQQAMQMNVDQLVQFIRSELALKQHTDRQLAAYLKKIQLTEKLTDKAIIDLEAQGAGPKTTQALQELRDQTASLKPAGHDVTYSPATAPDSPVAAGMPAAHLQTAAPPIPPPDSIRQQQILELMKEYALNYTQNLPNFICVQVTRRYVDPRASDHFQSIGTVLAKVSYNEGRENYKVYSVNGQYQDTDMQHLPMGGGGAISSGEFGSLMRQIFEPDSEAEFGWDHWATLRGRRMAVFNYFIDSGHSKYSIDYSAGPNDEQRIITAYKGLIYADENTGEIDRIKFVAVNIPRSFPVSEATEILDYDLVTISGHEFVCPLMARLFMTAGREKSKNEIEFRDYRKFGTDSQIQYGAEAPPPVPESQTQEEPATFSTTGTAGTKGTAASPETVTTAPATPERTKQPGTTTATGSPNPWALPTPPPPPPQ
jgi:hypothetical protein